MIKKDDEFGGRCRARTVRGKRCTRKVRWLVPICVSRESWLAAIRTGWPRLTRGMKEPEYRQVGYCYRHGGDGKPARYIYGVGKMGKPKLDAEYEAANAEGDRHVQSQGYSI